MTNYFDQFMDRKFCYSALVTDVYDGDTITCDVDCGFGICLKQQKMRLFGVDTEELRDKDPTKKEIAYQTRDWLREKILQKTIDVYTIKDTKGKYGRWLCILVTPNGENINKLLIELGFSHLTFY